MTRRGELGHRGRLVCIVSAFDRRRKGTPMKLSRTVGYALQATLQLAEAEPGTPVPCSQLAAQGQMPERFLLQILRNLVTHGILHSTRGVEGGYALERPADEISLLDLIEAVDGPVFSHTSIAEGLPRESLDQLSAALQQVTAAARKQLSSIKISSLVTKPR
jgi:Rrf2 family transcriptional regulator, cysteine metabolism repressor